MKKTNISKSVALATILSVAGTASAFAGNIYVDGGVGAATTTLPSGTSFSGNTNDTHLSTGIAAGYQQAINDSWDVAGELGYNYFGKASYSQNNASMSFTTSSIDFAGIGTYHINQDWSVFGKGGMAYMHRYLHI